MKLKILAIAVMICFAWFPACDNLVNSVDNDKNLSVDGTGSEDETMSAEDTAQTIDDIIDMGINSTSGVLTITFDTSDPYSEEDGVHIELTDSSGCVGFNGGGFYPYGSGSWEAGFDIVFNNCTADSGTVYNGTLSIDLTGFIGSVSTFDFTGNISASGAIEGAVDIDVQFNMASCVVSAGWDCWNGTVNGFSLETLNDIETN